LDLIKPDFGTSYDVNAQVVGDCIMSATIYWYNHVSCLATTYIFCKSVFFTTDWTNQLMFMKQSASVTKQLQKTTSMWTVLVHQHCQEPTSVWCSMPNLLNRMPDTA